MFQLMPYSAVSYAQETNSNYRTWISAQKANGYLNVTGNFENNSEQCISISYLLFSSRDGKAGTSSTTQRGNAEIRTKEKSVL